MSPRVLKMKESFHIGFMAVLGVDEIGGYAEINGKGVSWNLQLSVFPRIVDKHCAAIRDFGA